MKWHWHDWRSIFTTYHLWVTDNLFRNPFLIPMDTLYALIAKLGYPVELLDLPTLKRTIVAQKPVWKQRKKHHWGWGIVVDSQSDGVLECKCETQWVRLCSLREKLQVTHSPTFQYHLHYISLEIVPWNWVCKACEASGTSWGTKRSRWWHWYGWKHFTCRKSDFRDF